MQFTRESDYALKGLGVLAEADEDALLPVSEIAEARDLPVAFLARIFRSLVKRGILQSTRGRGNGYSLARSAESITMREVIEAVEGSEVFERCLLWREHCHDENPCPIHHRLKAFRPEIEALLDTTTLADYVADSPHAKSNARQ